MKQNHHDPAEQKIKAIEAEPMWYKELAELDIPPPSWIVDKLIPDKGITIISAPPRQFKTWLTYDIVLQIAHGDALFGQFETKQTNALIIDEESGPGRLRERLQKLGITNDAPIAILPKTGFKLTEASVKGLITYCEDQNIGVIVFDSLTRLHNADENNAQAMAAVMDNFDRLSRAGLSVLLIHHNRKPNFGNPGGANEMRGSGDILAACDVQISMRRDGNSRVVKVTQNKNRDAEEMSPFNLELLGNDGRCWFEYRGDEPKTKPKREQAEELITELLTPDRRLFQSQIVTELKGKVGEQNVTKALKDMTEQNKLKTSPGNRNKTYYQLIPEQSDE